MFSPVGLVCNNCESIEYKKKGAWSLSVRGCHGMTSKLIDYKFTMVPATQFVSGSGIQSGP